jgi:uncharacterized membrane protein
MTAREDAMDRFSSQSIAMTRFLGGVLVYISINCADQKYCFAP